MDRFGWAELIALLTSIGFGTVSAVVPVVNAEAYVIASQVSAVAGPIPIAIGIAIGQTVGKLLLFFGVREGKELSFIKHRREARKQRPVGPGRARFRAATAKLLDLVGQKRWGATLETETGSESRLRCETLRRCGQYLIGMAYGVKLSGGADRWLVVGKTVLVFCRCDRA